MNILTTVFLLIGSNVFMNLAWYGHLRFKDKSLLLVILISWGIAFFEYCLHVPANRMGHATLSAAQLKTLQEAITFFTFAGVSYFWLRERLTNYDLIAFALILIGVAVSVLQPR
ncbi:MAG: DMT family protein [Oligoflexus sp.]